MQQFDLVIVGAGGFGRELHTMLRDVYCSEEYRFKGFLADAPNAKAEMIGPILGAPEDYQPDANERFLLAIGEMGARVRTTKAITAKGGEFVSFVHPRAFICPTAVIEKGAVIYPFAVVSSSSRVDRHVHLNYFASVGHDAEVGQYCLLAPYGTLNGFVVLEDSVYVSTHATIVGGRRVGKGSKISANSAVMQDVPPHSMVFGVPGKVTRLLLGT